MCGSTGVQGLGQRRRCIGMSKRGELLRPPYRGICDDRCAVVLLLAIVLLVFTLSVQGQTQAELTANAPLK